MRDIDEQIRRAGNRVRPSKRERERLPRGRFCSGKLKDADFCRIVIDQAMRTAVSDNNMFVLKKLNAFRDNIIWNNIIFH